MDALPFEKLKASLTEGCFFSHTNVDNAAIRLAERMKQSPTVVSIGIIGDDDVESATNICKALIPILNKVGTKDEFEIIVGDNNRCAHVVNNFAKKSNVESYVINQRTEDNWKSESTPYEEMVDKIIEMSDILIFLTGTNNGSRKLQYPYHKAVVDGCFVTKRIIRRSKYERANDTR